MLRATYNPRADAAAAGGLRHELGHLLARPHVDSDREVMAPGATATGWGPGNRLSLWELGPQSCERRG